MEMFFDLLKFVLPSVVVFLTAFYSIKYFLHNESRRRLEEFKLANQKVITPLKLQAYERVVLFLERISPSGLVLRINKRGMSAQSFYSELLRTIRDEFEHNLSQQVYMSNNAWEKVLNAKEETVKIINIAYGRVSPNDDAMELGKQVIGVASQLEKLPSKIAIEALKKEVSIVF